MGAWDYGIFDNDTAYEFFEEIEADPAGFFASSFNQARDAEYIEYDDGVAALVSAAYLDNLLHGTFFHNDNEEQQDLTNVNCFQEVYDGEPLDGLAKAAAVAIHAVRTGNSELRELWEENEELYPVWVLHLEEMEERLKG